MNKTVLLCLLIFLNVYSQPAPKSPSKPTKPVFPASEAGRSPSKPETPKIDETLIPEFQQLTKENTAFKCLVTLKPVLSAMSKEEQGLWFEAFIAAKGGNKDDTNMKTCFDREVVRKGIRDVVNQHAKSLNKGLTTTSKKFRHALTCLKSTFDQLRVNLASQEKLNANVREVLSSQVSANQCATDFLTKLLNILNARKRYLLLNTVDLTNLARISESVINFPWSEDEMNTIVPAFIDYANCYTSLPNSYYTGVQDVYVALSKDEVCTGTSTLRFLQDVPAITLTQAPGGKRPKKQDSSPPTTAVRPHPVATSIKPASNPPIKPETPTTNANHTSNPPIKPETSTINTNPASNLPLKPETSTINTNPASNLPQKPETTNNTPIETEINPNVTTTTELPLKPPTTTEISSSTEQSISSISSLITETTSYVSTNIIPSSVLKTESVQIPSPDVLNIEIDKILNGALFNSISGISLPIKLIATVLESSPVSNILSDINKILNETNCEGTWDYSANLWTKKVTTNCPKGYESNCPTVLDLPYQSYNIIITIGCQGEMRYFEIEQAAENKSAKDLAKMYSPAALIAVQNFEPYLKVLNSETANHVFNDISETFKNSPCTGIWDYRINIASGKIITNCPSEFTKYCPIEKRLFENSDPYLQLNVFIGCENGSRTMKFFNETPAREAKPIDPTTNSTDKPNKNPSEVFYGPLFNNGELSSVRDIYTFLTNPSVSKFFTNLNDIIEGNNLFSDWSYTVHVPTWTVKNNCPDALKSYCPFTDKQFKGLPINVNLEMGSANRRGYFKLSQTGEKLESSISPSNLISQLPLTQILDVLNSSTAEHMLGDIRGSLFGEKCTGKWDYTVNLSNGEINCSDKLNCPEGGLNIKNSGLNISIFLGCDGEAREMKILPNTDVIPAIDSVSEVTGPYTIIGEGDGSTSLSSISLSKKTKKFINVLITTLKKRAAAQGLIDLLSIPTIESVRRKENLINQILAKNVDLSSGHIKRDVFDTIGGKLCTGTWNYHIQLIEGSEPITNYCTNDLCTNDSKLINFKNLNTYDQISIYIGCEEGTRYGVAYVRSFNSGFNFWDFIGVVEDSKVAAKTTKCAKELNSSLSVTTETASESSQQCLPAVKKTCSDIFNETCKEAGLGDAIKNLIPSESGESLPYECQISEGDSMKGCLAWINYNLLKNSLTVDFEKIYNLQATINISTHQTRILQESPAANIQVTAEDSLAKYPETQIEKSIYELSVSDLQIDGTTSEKAKSVDDIVAQGDNVEFIGSSFYTFSFGVIMTLVLMF
jgi:hypothetical protein